MAPGTGPRELDASPTLRRHGGGARDLEDEPQELGGCGSSATRSARTPRLAALPAVAVRAADARRVGDPVLPLQLLGGGEHAGMGGGGSVEAHPASVVASSTSTGHHGATTAMELGAGVD